MTRKLKRFGLSLIAALAMCAVAASATQANPSAQADGGGGTPTITGHQYNAGPEHPIHTVTLGGAGGTHLSCTTVTFDGTLEPNPDTSVTVTPTYEGCTATRTTFPHSTLPFTVTHNGCNFTLSGGTKNGTHHWINGKVEIVCPAGKVIEVHVYSSASNHASGTSLCTLTVGPQTLNNANTYLNTTTMPHEVDVTTTANVSFVRHGSALCGAENQVAVYTGATRGRAYSDTAHTKQISLTVI